MTSTPRRRQLQSVTSATATRPGKRGRPRQAPGQILWLAANRLLPRFSNRKTAANVLRLIADFVEAAE